jgi:deferrochelatase/peroxidase EfeB
LVSIVFDRTQIQGNILRGWRRNVVRHLILKVGDRSAARKFLGASVGGGNAEVPGITSETPWPDKKPPLVCFNIGVTYEGLRALGTPDESLATFPTEFREGMTSRALKLGDFGCSAPKNWPEPFDKPADVHIIVSVYADDKQSLDRVEAQVGRAFTVLDRRDGGSLAVDGKPNPDRVFFGYTDNISQPRFAEIQDDP